MAIKYLTIEQHQQIVKRLVELSYRVSRPSMHKEGLEYTSLMTCFLLHNISAAEALLKLFDCYGKEWFPITIGYVVARTMFETEVTAHYITLEPRKLSRQYIDFERILNKNEMDTCNKHIKSKNQQWSQAMKLVWENRWKDKENEINRSFIEVKNQFEKTNNKNKKVLFKNWSGKKFRDMAVIVNHEEAYDVFYAELSSFSHVDVNLANKFLRFNIDGPFWTRRPREIDVGNVFRHSASFLTCFMYLFGEQFSPWTKEDVERCWEF